MNHKINLTGQSCLKQLDFLDCLCILQSFSCPNEDFHEENEQPQMCLMGLPKDDALEGIGFPSLVLH